MPNFNSSAISNSNEACKGGIHTIVRRRSFVSNKTWTKSTWGLRPLRGDKSFPLIKEQESPAVWPTSACIWARGSSRMPHVLCSRWLVAGKAGRKHWRCICVFVDLSCCFSLALCDPWLSWTAFTEGTYCNKKHSRYRTCRVKDVACDQLP